MPLLARMEKGVQLDSGEPVSYAKADQRGVLVREHLGAHAEGARHLGDNNVTFCKNANSVTSVTMAKDL